MSTIHYLTSLRTTTPGRTESDIQSDIKGLLIDADLNLGAPNLEEPTGDGTKRRIDIAIGATVIEVKKSLTTPEGAVDEISQLAGYVKTRMRNVGGRYNGILTDGIQWWLFEVPPGNEGLQLVAQFILAEGNDDNLVEWLRSVLALPAGIVPRASTIEKYLGAESSGYAQDVAYLAGLYEESKDNPTTGLKRELWARLLRSALGADFVDDTRLFIDHSLLVLEAMAIGHAVMGVPMQQLLAEPRTMLTGEHFEEAGLHNIMEAGFFDWVKDTPEADIFLSKLIQRVNLFTWENVEHDVLKVLYESIIHTDTRRNLGEYYTPDYLAQGVIANTVDKPLEQRVLDPACGSGTFIFHIIRAKIVAANEASYTARQTIEHIQDHVFGLDIHPVSILLARITYLLALGELLQAEDRPELWAQVYLGDSIQWYQPSAHDVDEIRINTESDALDITVGGGDNGATTLFDIARTLVFPLAGIDNAQTFDRLVNDLTALARTYTDVQDKKPSCKKILNRYGILHADDASTLKETFDHLCELNATGRDSIWGYYVRNQVRPLWLSLASHKVDVLVGNPPWVAYRNMTDSMQAMYKTFAEARMIWEGKKLATQQDLVSLFIVRAAEKYLVEGGKFGFVTPYAVLSRGQYKVFREGKWGEGLRGKFTEVWDLDKLRPAPFPVPAAVVFGLKNNRDMGVEAPEVPFGWVDEIKTFSGLRNAQGWTQTLEQVEIGTQEAVTSSISAISPYRQTTFNGATIFPGVLFFYGEQPASALGMAAGRVKVKSARTNQEKKPWKDIPDVEFVVPKKYLHSVHKGVTLIPFGTFEPLKAVLPVANSEVIDVENMDSVLEPIAAWWETISDIWESNKTKSSKLSMMEQLNYQNKLSKQFPLTQHRVIYSASGNTLTAARLSNDDSIIEHALYWLPARSIAEAQYLVGILNAPVTTQMVEKYQSRGLFGARHFDTYVWNLPIPAFAKGNSVHERIVELSAACEAYLEQINVEGMGFQKARKIVRTALADAGLMEELNEAVEQLLNS